MQNNDSPIFEYFNNLFYSSSLNPFADLAHKNEARICVI